VPVVLPEPAVRETAGSEIDCVSPVGPKPHAPKAPVVKALRSRPQRNADLTTPTLHFKCASQKPLVLNKTNAKTLSGT
jgi:hypothetical protein